ncbi:MAG: hypothetical protein EPO32_06230 [Anaerolineae bacterium]|nr:MAG: hypothetical protein EPO32_06230 [Anaerolineae bacterium]
MKERIRQIWKRETLFLALELLLIIAAAAWLGRDYLKLDDTQMSPGAEFFWVIQTHHFWDWVKECGTCALWNGSERGGFPALVDLQGAVLHPVVILTTWFLGVVNGAKWTVVISMALAGLAQWWLARELGLGRVPRLWSGILAAIGAHLAGRMELAWIGIILSTASAALVFPAVYYVLRKNSNGSAVVLGVILAMAVVSGQGYVQIGLLFAAPAFFILLIKGRGALVPSFPKFMLAGAIAVLLAAPLLVPFGHFSSQFDKPSDTSGKGSQPLGYLVLNFVIADKEFLRTPALDKPTSAAHTAQFIGWVPVLLAALVLTLNRREDRRNLWFLAAATGLVLFLASGWLLEKYGANYQFLTRVRNPLLIMPLAVTPLLGLAAYGLDQFLKRSWPFRLSLQSEDPRTTDLNFDLKWLILIALLVNLRNVSAFSRSFLSVTTYPEHYTQVMDSIELDSHQWITFPENQWTFIEPGIRRGFKLSPGILPWAWKGREWPKPILEVSAGDRVPEGGISQGEIIPNYTLYSFEDNREYAYVEAGEDIYPCKGSGTGGKLTVTCDSPTAGTLVVKENYFTGWSAAVDGQPSRLVDDQWLSVVAPAGAHTFTFEYRPWDVWAGVGLAGLGVALAVFSLIAPAVTRRRERRAALSQ